MPSDKEGGFAVLTKRQYFEKAQSAISTVFDTFTGIDLRKVKARAKDLCRELNLEGLVKKLDRCDKLSLNLFFSAKTHKPDVPFRVIVSECGSWQKNVGVFLQDKMKLFTINDPFLIKKSDEVIEFFRQEFNTGLMAFSIDVKDLYYSLPHDALLTCIEECIDQFGGVSFQNSTGMSARGFLDLLGMYLNSTYVEWNDNVYLQKQGVSIGSCLAPILSDLLLAKMDRAVNQELVSTAAKKVFRFVDDFLVIVKCDPRGFVSHANNVLSLFKKYLGPLVLTHEMPENSSIRFLDLRLTFRAEHTCWEFQPRAGKPLLPYTSAHSKLVKRGIVSTCFTNALDRSCMHSMEASFHNQVARLKSAGYPEAVLVSVAESIRRKRRAKDGQGHGAVGRDNRTHEKERERVAVVPYMHQVTHRLKKVGQRMGVRVVSSAPHKLSQLARLTCGARHREQRCKTKHRNRFVNCIIDVVYMIILSCGACYIGQTGRCLNDRLREHACNVRSGNDGYLAQHVTRCGCEVQFDKTVVLQKHKDERTRLIIEAAHIAEHGACVSKPSIALSDKELAFLNISRCRRS